MRTVLIWASEKVSCVLGSGAESIQGKWVPVFLIRNSRLKPWYGVPRQRKPETASHYPNFPWKSS